MNMQAIDAWSIACLIYLVLFSFFSKRNVIDKLPWIVRCEVFMFALLSFGIVMISLASHFGIVSRKCYNFIFPQDALGGAICGFIVFAVGICVIAIMVTRLVCMARIVNAKIKRMVDTYFFL